MRSRVRKKGLFCIGTVFYTKALRGMMVFHLLTCVLFLQESLSPIRSRRIFTELPGGTLIILRSWRMDCLVL